MPSISSIFRRHQTNSVYSSPDDSHKHKSKRRSRLFWSKEADVGRTADNHAPGKTAPGPPRAFRASTTNVPELPSSPIYRTVNPDKHLSSLPEGVCHGGRPSRERRLPRVATIANFHALGHGNKPEPGQNGTAPAVDRLPAYDQAAELAKYYQSVLPDFRKMFEEDEELLKKNDRALLNGQQRASQGKQHACRRNPQNEREEEEEGGTPSEETLGVTRLAPPPNPTRNDTLSGASSTTAVGSEDSEPAQSPAQQQAQPQPKSSSQSQQQQNDNIVCPLSTQSGTRQPPPERQSEDQFAEPKSPLEPFPDLPVDHFPEPPSPTKPAARDPSPQPSPESTATTAAPTPRSRRSRVLSQHSAVGLQICTELLTEQLAKALALDSRTHNGEDEPAEPVGQGSPPSRTDCTSSGGGSGPKGGHQVGVEGNSRRSQRKLQVLLLIEAYEGVLRACRREMQSSSAVAQRAGSDGAGSGGDDALMDRRRGNNVGEAVPILENWLDTLNRIYDADGDGDC